MIVINSFSKYYSSARLLIRTRTPIISCVQAQHNTGCLAVTGWRLGWLVVPDHLDSCVDALNQNMNVSAPTVSQRAAVSALSALAKPELEAHVRRYEANRQVVIETLAAIGISESEYARPQGAFYLYADLRAHGVTDSLAFCDALLTEAGVAMTPGVDFEEPSSGLGECRVRIGFPGSTEDVRAAMEVLAQWWTSTTSLQLRGQLPSK